MRPLVLAARVGLVVYLGLVAMVVFQPRPEMAVGSVSRAGAWLARLGVPEVWLNEYRVEFFMNTLLFAPIPFLGMLALSRVRWSEWVVASFVLSVAIEVTQGLLFPYRSATFVDIVSNTTGGLLGAAVAGVCGVSLRHASQSRGYMRA